MERSKLNSTSSLSGDVSASSVSSDELKNRSSTPRQQKRRLTILGAVYDLISERGYDGVTMLDIAQESGVVRKTLYNIYGSKENLVAAAMNERMKAIFDAQPKSHGHRGWERLLYIVDLGVAGMLETPNFSKALASVLFGDVTMFPYTEYFEDERRRALEEMNATGDFELWADVDRLTRLTRFELSAVIMLWARNRIDNTQIGYYSRLAIAQVLLGPSGGAVHERIAKTLKAAHEAIAESEKV